MKTLILVVVIMICTGCAHKLYYWGDYSSTLYKFKKDPSDAKRADHKEELLDIIEKSKDKEKKVPPGVYCELGYMLHYEGNKDEALKYFILEEETYPESIFFIGRLKSHLFK